MLSVTSYLFLHIIFFFTFPTLFTNISRYPDMTSDHLTALLLLRGDLGRLDVRQRVAEIMEEMRTQRTGPAPKSIFSHIVISTSLFT